MGRITNPSEKKGFARRRKEAEIQNVEGKGKGKNKTHKGDYSSKHLHLLLPYQI